MISKKAFCDIMRELHEYNIELDKFADLGIEFEDNALTRIMPRILDALSSDLNDRVDDWIGYYAWELDWGTDKNASTCLTVDDEIRPLTTPEELYDLIMELNAND